MADPISVASSPVESVIFCSRLGPRPAGFSFKATSLPGHLIHIVTSGRVRQECNGREYLLKPGAVIWYHEDELVRGLVLQGPWIWYSVGFIARSLPPPGFEFRQFFPEQDKVTRPFESMLKAWNDVSLPAMIRTLRVHGGLLEILNILLSPLLPRKNANVTNWTEHADPRARLWWEIETKLRMNLERPVTLAGMGQLCGRSQATIARSCKYAVGLPPLKRVKQVRMSLARGLVQHSQLTMSEIASRIGYDRVHEFSRDYRKNYGFPPTHHRGKKV